MIHDLPEWWSLLTYYGLKYHVYFTEILKDFSEERIEVGKEDSGKRAFNKVYDKFHARQDNITTRHLLVLERWNINECINQWNIIMIIYIST